MELYIVTGLSGAGKSVALKVLEDNGCFCIDNLPDKLFAPYLALALQTQEHKKIAIGIDIRSGISIAEITSVMASWRAQNLTAKIIFLTAQYHTLIKRFQETRRKHPLSNTYILREAIAHEKSMLEPLKKIADITIETDTLTIHELKRVIRSIDDKSEETHKNTVTLMSFGFKNGLPLESNFVFDVRFLPNPYFIPGISHLDGTTQEIQEYLFKQQAVLTFWEHFVDFCLYTLEKSFHEGTMLVTIAIGCTGGRHRSVAIVERLAKLTNVPYSFMVKHRDINKDEYKAPDLQKTLKDNSESSSHI